MLQGGAKCTENTPCPRFEPCTRCQAQRYLCDTDWYLIGFYNRVSDQYINQAPMGSEKGKPLPLTPRLEGYRAALAAFRYPRRHHRWLLDGALMLHRLVHRLDEVNWGLELGKEFHAVVPSDVIDGYAG